MRLFVAITFDDVLKDGLCGAIEKLRPHTVSGNFTRRENFHLTLEFIGETLNSSAAAGAMESIEGKRFLLKVGGIGCFNRDGGKICWLGVEQSRELMELQNNVHRVLLGEGFRLENRPFKPHLTLGREVVLEEGFFLASLDEILPGLSMDVEKISLMKSERISGKLVYTEIKSVDLKK